MKLTQISNILILSAFLLFPACSDDDQSKPLTVDDFPIAHGFEVRDVLGQRMGDIGTPNINTGDHPSNHPDSSQYFVNIFPNPVRDGVFMFTLSGTAMEDVENTKVHLRFKPMINQIYPMGGPYEIKDHDFSNFDTNTPLELSITLKTNHDSVKLNVDPDDPSPDFLPEGLYRVYFEIDEIELYDNIYLKAK